MQIIPTNEASPAPIQFYLVDSTDFETPEDITVTGVKPTVYIGGTALTGTAADIVKISGSQGLYSWTPTQSQINVASGLTLVGRLKPTGCATAFFRAQIGPSTALLPTPDSEDIADAVITASETTPLEVNVVKMNDADVTGNGTSGNKWRGA